MSTVLTCALSIMYASANFMLLPMLTVAAAAAGAVVGFWILAASSINAAISAASSRRGSQTNGGATTGSSSSSDSDKAASSTGTPSGIGRGRLDSSTSSLVSACADTPTVFYECNEPGPHELLWTCNQVS